MSSQPKSDRVRVACIGAGQFANLFHYPSLARLAEREGTVEVVALADMDEARREQTGRKWGIARRFADADEMLAEMGDAVDAVYAIMTPGPLPPVATRVLRAGKHLFTEKPAAKTSGEVEDLVAEAERAGVATCVGTNRRYSPLWRRAVEIVTENGPASGALAAFHKPMDKPMFDMSVLHADVLHVIDPLRDLLGEVAEVRGQADLWYGGDGWSPHSDNVFNAMLRFENGGGGLVTANRRAGARIERFELHGEFVTVVAELPNRLTVYRRGKDPEVLAAADIVGEGDADDMLMTYGYYHETKAFVDAIRNGSRPPTHLGDHLKLLKVCDAIAGDDHVEAPR